MAFHYENPVGDNMNVTKDRITKMGIIQSLLLVILNAFQALIVKTILIDRNIEVTTFKQLMSFNFYSYAISSILTHYLTYVFLLLAGITLVQGLGLYTRIDAVRMALITNLDNAIIVVFGIFIMHDPVTIQLIGAFCCIMFGYWILVTQVFDKT